MAFTERHEHKIEIIPPYHILQCRRADIVEKDGKEVGRTYERHVKVPGEDMSEECPEMQAVAAALWTQDIIDAFKARKKDSFAQAQPAEETILSNPAE